MKKSVILSLLLMLASNFAIAQRSYSFDGVPLEGTLEHFAEMMELHLFDVDVQTRFPATKYYYMTGYFFGEECQHLLLNAKGEFDMVAGVNISTPEQDTWKKTFEKYKEFKKKFTELYGKPFKVIEEKGPNNPKTDEEMFNALRKAEAAYICCFHDDQGDGAEGTVILSISCQESLFSPMTGFLEVKYLNNAIKASIYGLGRDLDLYK